MSTTADMRICTDPSADRLPLTSFAAIVDALRTLLGEEIDFYGFRVFEGGALAPVHRVRDRIGADDLLSRLRRWDTPAKSISARLMIPRYEEDQHAPELRKSNVAAWIRSSGGRHAGRTGDWWIDGDLHLVVDPVTPYLFPSSPDGKVLDRVDVRENVNLYVDLILAVVETLRPPALKVFTDAGEPFPFNAHLAYYADTSGVTQDAQLIRSLFMDGHPALELPPLGDIDGDLARFAFHLWRHRDQQKNLQQSLAWASGVRTASPGATDPGVRGSARLTPRAVGPGFVLYDHQSIFNSFVDSFYLRAIVDDAASGSATP